MTIGERIREKIRQKGISQNQLARMAGISQSGLSTIISGANGPTESTLRAIAGALECSVGELLGEGENIPSNLLQMIRGAVPIVGEIACGTPILAQENIEGRVDLPEGVRADFALRCKGTSMEPLFKDGDLVLIRQQEDADDGKIAAVLIGNEATLKRIHRIPGGLMLLPENTAEFAPQIYQGEEAASIRILGVAVSYVRMI